jgi:hypothetical protein
MLYSMRSRRRAFQRLVCIGFACILLAGSEGQRFGELDGDSTQETVDVIDPADMT